MRLSIFGYIVLAVVLGAPIAAIYSFVHARRKGLFHPVDIGTLLGPPLIFIFVGYFRPELHIGWAMVLWPIILGVLSMYVFALKIAVIDRWLSKPRGVSIGVFAFCSLASVILAIVVGPWYD